MVKAKRIGHATFETPDLARQTEYYTDLLGLTVAAREKDSVFLATKIGQLAIQLNKGDRERCVKLSFEVAPNSDFGELARELGKDGIKSELRNDSVPGIGAVLAFQDNKGTTVELFKDWSYLGKHTPVSGVGPLKLGHVAWVVNDVQATVDFYHARARLPGVRLDRRFLRLHPLQRGPPHAQLHPRQEREDASHGVRAEGRGAPAIRLRPHGPAQASDPVGTAAPRPRPQHGDPPPQSRRPGDRALLRARPDARRGARLFRAAPLAPRHAAAPEGLAARAQQLLGSAAPARAQSRPAIDRTTNERGRRDA